MLGNLFTVFRIIDAAPGSLSIGRRGQVSFSLRFAKALDKNVTALIIAQTQTVIKVNRDRLVSYE